MNGLIETHPKELMDQHQEALRSYAQRVLGEGETLPIHEQEDSDRRTREFLAMGRSFHLTGREMVNLIYGGLFQGKRECGCHSCRARLVR